MKSWIYAASLMAPMGAFAACETSNNGTNCVGVPDPGTCGFVQSACQNCTNLGLEAYDLGGETQICAPMCPLNVGDDNVVSWPLDLIFERAGEEDARVVEQAPIMALAYGMIENPEGFWPSSSSQTRENTRYIKFYEMATNEADCEPTAQSLDVSSDNCLAIAAADPSLGVFFQAASLPNKLGNFLEVPMQRCTKLFYDRNELSVIVEPTGEEGNLNQCTLGIYADHSCTTAVPVQVAYSRDGEKCPILPLNQARFECYGYDVQCVGGECTPNPAYSYAQEPSDLQILFQQRTCDDECLQCYEGAILPEACNVSPAPSPDPSNNSTDSNSTDSNSTDSNSTDSNSTDSNSTDPTGSTSSAALLGASALLGALTLF